MYVRFAIAVLPLLAVLLYRTLSVSDLPRKLEHLFVANNHALAATSNYKTFLNGVSDAVDTGKLSEKALKALADSRDGAKKLSAAIPDLPLAGTIASLDKIHAAVTAKNAIESLMPLRADINGADAGLAKPVEDVKQLLATVIEDDARAEKRKQQLAFGAILATLVMMVFIVRQLVRSITVPIGSAVEAARRIASGDLGGTIPAGAKDETGVLLGSLAQMQGDLKTRIEGERHTAAENLRVRIALDNSDTGVMIANARHDIIYANTAMSRIARAAAAGFASRARGFDPDLLIGKRADQLFEDPATVARTLADFTSTFEHRMNVAGRDLVASANPVITAAGERLGSVIEWRDRTHEVETETEIQGMIDAASRGDFSRRIEVSGSNDFFVRLAGGLNTLAGTIDSSLKDVGTVLRAVSQGDLTQKIETGYEGILGQLKDDTNATVERLREVVGRIKEATDTISHASQEIATGNQDLSTRTEEQARHVAETSRSMNEINGTVAGNADNAAQASDLARTSNEVVGRGGETVKKVVATMHDIQESSKRISDIIGAIDGIAFQINILALNAAVEAARAGEHGRGFAVVAAEVRSLAQRSANSAKEIKILISESVDKVRTGDKLAKEAGAAMSDVIEKFHQVAGLVTEIAQASRAQVGVIGQVNGTVTRIDESTHQNAALVQQAAAAAESLAAQSRGLVEAVAMFKLDTGPAPVRSVPGPGAARQDWADSIAFEATAPALEYVETGA
jgi:methyl-accepting chemotaxis protein